MRTRLLLLAVLAAATSGCVIHEHDHVNPQPLPGNVNLVWTFGDGQTCASLGGFIDHIEVTIPGESLASNGIYPCQINGTQGIQLQDFAPGTYSFTVNAIGTGNYVAYSATGSFTVNGDVTVSTVLQRVSAAPGNLLVYWTFPNGMSCASAGASSVVINIPGEQLQNAGIFPCVTNGVQGIQLNNFAPGTYQVSVTAQDSYGHPLYQGGGNATVNGDTQVTIGLVQTQGSIATLQLRWSFLDASNVAHTCAAAGIQNVTVTLGSYAPITVPCDYQGIDGADFQYLATGVYEVILSALDATNTPQFTYDQNIAVAAPTTTANVQLVPLNGSWDLSYNLANAASCAIAGVAQVSLSVKDSAGNEISGIAPGTRYSCQDNPNNLFHWDSFPGGSVTIQMYGYDSAGNRIRGAYYGTNLAAGAANQTLVTLTTCGTSNSGC